MSSRVESQGCHVKSRRVKSRRVESFSEVLNPADDWMYVMKSEKVLEDGGLLPWWIIGYYLCLSPINQINQSIKVWTYSVAFRTALVSGVAASHPSQRVSSRVKSGVIVFQVKSSLKFLPLCPSQVASRQICDSSPSQVESSSLKSNCLGYIQQWFSIFSGRDPKMIIF